MTTEQFFSALLTATTAVQVEELLESYLTAHPNQYAWVPFGKRPNNRGIIEVSTDPGRSVIERVTNGIDAVLEAEFEAHSGVPSCRTPKEAAVAWLGVPLSGLSELSTSQRRALAKKVQVTLLAGEGKHSRVLEVRDFGIGLAPRAMPDTILSLNESNKIQKHYLAGAYGQGGASTLAVSKFVIIASRDEQSSPVGFTVACYQDLPAEEYKTGRYVYLALGDSVLKADVPLSDFAVGTLVRHVGYELSSYPSPLGPNSLYGLLNQVLFDPVIPIWFDNQVNDYRRVIKGARNALNGAVDTSRVRRSRSRRSPNSGERISLNNR